MAFSHMSSIIKAVVVVKAGWGQVKARQCTDLSTVHAHDNIA